MPTDKDTDVKPLFRPEAVRPKVKAFLLPDRVEAVRPKLLDWAWKLSKGKLDKLKETELLPGYLAHVFGELLGYVGPAGHPDAYTMKLEALVEVDGKRADAAFGRFAQADGKPVLVLEGKGPKDVLDRPFAGRKLSAVQQASLYAMNMRLDWYIATNIREIRLFSKRADQFTFERFRLETLMADEYELKRFVYLLGSERVLGPLGKNHLDDLIEESKKIGRELTNDFYGEYRALRLQTFEALRQHNPGRDAEALLAATQKLLDRILFIAFCEDRGLLPRETIAKAFQHSDPYNPHPVWETFKGLFRSVDKGEPRLEINEYNGKLYAPDAFLDSLTVPDAICEGFKKIADYEYGGKDEGESKLIDVEILGHVFEQSISDLEEMQNVLAGKLALAKPKEQKRSSRKDAGAFYTPAFITRYIVQETLRPVLETRFEALKAVHSGKAKGKPKKALAAPAEYILDELNDAEKQALIDFWGAWLVELETVRIVDPACGSGAFLLEAFTQMFDYYRLADGYLVELGGKSLFDIRKAILEHNLYGVDLNEAAVGIARLSCWIQTAEGTKKLTSLDHNFRHGNSVVTDPAVHPKAFDWQTAFPEVFAAGGFDIVVGNPPYVRQEWIKDYKQHFAKQFPSVYASTADLYVYFYELGYELLKPGGRLAFISSNSFVRAGFGENIREFLTTKPRLSQVIDLGDTSTFSDAKDVNPAIVIFEKLATENASKAGEVLSARFRKDERGDDIRDILASRGLVMPVSNLERAGWRFESNALKSLRAKLNSEKTLGKVVSGKIYLGVKTGLNDAFVVPSLFAEPLLKEDAKKYQQILKPIAGGQELRRWYQEDSGNYAIIVPNGFTRIESGRADEASSWDWFAAKFPAVAEHLLPFQTAAMKRDDQGEHWWELRPCDYYSAFDNSKIMYPDIAKFPRFSMDQRSLYSANTTYIIPSSDYYLLGVLNTDAIWFAISGISIPFGERAGEFRYRLFTQYMENIPIPDAPAIERDAIAKLAEMCNGLGEASYRIEEAFRHRLAQTFRIEPETKLNEKAQDWWELDFIPLGEALKASFKRKQNPFTAPRTADEWEPYFAEKRSEVRALRRKLADAEAEINERVYRLFALTPAEVKLLKQEVEH